MGFELGRREFLGGVAMAGVAAGMRPGKAFAKAAAYPALGEQVGEALLREYPQNATILGVATGEFAKVGGHWQDQTLAGFEKRKAAINNRLKTLMAGVDERAIGAPGGLDLLVAKQAHELAAEGYAFDYGDPVVLDPNNGFRNTPYVVNQLGSAFVDIPDFLDSRVVVEDRGGAERFASLVDDYARNIDGETERMKRDRAAGVVAPDFVLDKTIGIIGGGAAEKPDTSAIVKLLEAKLHKAGLADARIVNRVRTAMGANVIPALQRQVAELKRHRAVAKGDAGVWHVKDGEAYYDWALKAGTTTTHSPKEIHQLGLDQWQAIDARMDAILRKMGMTGGTVSERMAAVSKRPDQLFRNTDAGRAQLLTYLNGRIADIRTRLPRAFATMVPANMVIKRVPVSIQDGAPGGYASAGSIDGKVPGVYFINLKDTGDWPKLALPTLCYHEGIPGHIWQGDFANRMPLVRSMLAFNAYSEGWALYAEQLADELGAYDGDPFGQLGYLQSQGFRACRLVVDTGLHSLKWSRAEANAWFTAHNGESPASIASEVDRYCAMPGQACGYKVGQLEILRLRDKAQKAMGAKYDLRTFDDAVVKGGSVPMTLLETVIDRYINA